MSLNSKSIHLLIAEDDEEDRMLTQEALIESRLNNTVHFVEDGEYLMDYLHNKGKYTDKVKYPSPGLFYLT